MSQVVHPNPITQAAEARPVRDIPVWLTIVILLLCIGGGGWLVWKYTKTNAPGPIVIAPGNPRAALVKNWRPSDDAGMTGRTPKRNQDDDSDGIKALTPGRSWRVKAGNAYMFVNLTRKNEAEITPNYRSIYTPEQNNIVIMRQRLMQDDAMREFLKITPDQLAKLRSGVPPAEGMKIAPDEKKKLTDLFEAYRAAKDSKGQEASEKALVATLDEIGKKRFEETKAYMIKRVETIQAIVTPEQMKMFHEGPSKAGSPVPPGAAPQLLKSPAEAPKLPK